MDAWNSATTFGADGLSGFSSQLPDILNLSDPLLAKIITSKKALQLLESNIVSGVSEDGEESNTNNENKAIIELLMSACDGDVVTLESITRSNPQIVNQLFPSDENGATALVYAVCFNNPDIVESLLENHKADPDIPDSIVNYTPIMWAVHLNYLNIVQLLLDHQADLFLSPKDDGTNASTLVFPENTEMYEYFRSHNLLKTNADNSQDIYQA
ncbi:hypothetical protein MG9_00475, partial [Candida albicans P37037]